MTTSKLPARPSLESLRKQPKNSRAASLPAMQAPSAGRVPNYRKPNCRCHSVMLSLVLAREYGFPGWQDLVKEVNQRLGKGIEWAVSQAHRSIHDNDIEGLHQLLAEYPALLSWRADENGGLLGMATDSFGDSFDAFREQHFTRATCAELLIDAGAVVASSVCDGLIASRARGA